MKSKTIEQVVNLELGQGSIVKALPYSISIRGNPLLITNVGNKEIFLEMVVSNHKTLSEIHNEERDSMFRILNQRIINEEYVIRIIDDSINEFDGYPCVSFIEDDHTKRFSIFEAHNVLVSNNIFYSKCISKLKSSSKNLMSYNAKKQLVGGSLRCSNQDKRPEFEENNLPIERIIAEVEIANRMIIGDKKLGYKGIKQRDNTIVRFVDENKRTTKKKGFNYLFELVVTIRESDRAYDLKENRQLITCVMNNTLQHVKSSTYDKGDVVRDLVIVGVRETQNYGLVGIGYIPRSLKELMKMQKSNNPISYLKTIKVIGGEDYLGSIVRESEIISQNKNAILTQI
jgi:hypothetical protein